MGTAVVMMSSLASASPHARVRPDRMAPGEAPTAAVCGGGGENHCYAHVRIDAAGEILANAGPGTPAGFGPAELQSAYQIDLTKPMPPTPPTIAIVDAYGYANLESDLATYRSQFGLPPCTVSNGCLKIVNQRGTAALPPAPPADDDWTVETALDVDMASAACPHCKILVVLSDSPSNLDLYTAQNAAAAAGATVISDSWGAPQAIGQDLTPNEQFFNHPGIAQFVAAGDSGYNEGGGGPAYPSTSAHVIAVGGTALVKSTTARGWSETAWTKGGSSCSYSIPKPAHQTATGCSFRAASDIAAVGDPATGVAVFNAANNGWLVIGGTSAAAPLVAAIFAASGRGNATAAGISQSTGSLFDVTAGSNGACGAPLCVAGAGWDGPTGYGTPSSAALAGGTGPGTGPGGGGGGGGALAVAITSPADGDTLDAGFAVTATATGATEVGLVVDGTLVES
ncbi:MAG TPA: hypothetical protein VK607_09340, partial [Kofleriaceae bacterium]|nr:hypothetical protein [Kofleriaceae bacterium]